VELHVDVRTTTTHKHTTESVKTESEILSLSREAESSDRVSVSRLCRAAGTSDALTEVSSQPHAAPHTACYAYHSARLRTHSIRTGMRALRRRPLGTGSLDRGRDSGGDGSARCLRAGAAPCARGRGGPCVLSIAAVVFYSVSTCDASWRFGMVHCPLLSLSS